jgi:predicted HTH transcriptional regulator
MTRSNLIQKIRLGEDSFLELKDVRFEGSRMSGPRQEVLADEMAAFANSFGGELVLGVDDKSHEVTGIPLDKLDIVETRLREACGGSIDPSLAPIIERMTLPNKAGEELPVIRVEVPRSLFVHESPGGYMHRVGSSKMRIPPDQLARLFQQRSQSRLIRFDETPVMTATLADMDEYLWRKLRPRHSKDPNEIMLSKMAMLSQDEEGVWRPTVAGILLGCENPCQFLPTAYIQAVAYRGTTVVPQGDGNYQIDAQDITGPLDRQIMDACAFVRRNMFVAAQKPPEGGGRIDKPEYDIWAVFEAITNAVAHRDYSMPGSKVRLRMFEDRLEIYTPGMLPNTMTTETLSSRQSARNEAIASLLSRIPVRSEEISLYRQHIMYRRGEGVGVVLERSEQLSGKRPVYEMPDPSELILTIYANPEARMR